MDKRRNRRKPTLSFTSTRGIGWHVSYRDPATGTPRKHAFGIKSKGKAKEAKAAYQAWLSAWLSGEVEQRAMERERSRALAQTQADASVGSIASVVNAYIERKVIRRARANSDATTRTRGSIDPRVAADRRKHLKDFIAFLDGRHGPEHCNTHKVSDLKREDIETFNGWLVSEKAYSDSQVTKRLHIVHCALSEANRSEHGSHGLRFEWADLDRVAGRPSKPKVLPTVRQLKRLLSEADLEGQLMIWMGIGLGFGFTDLRHVRVGQIDADGYDLRRSKTGVDRYGETPPLVWAHLEAYISTRSLRDGQPLFPELTERDRSVFYAWWRALRKAAGESRDTLDGFYCLRHLGATEFGSRPGASLGAMKRWLGHGASSQMSDTYLRPVAPEYRKVVEWTRDQLQGGSVNAGLVAA